MIIKKTKEELLNIIEEVAESKLCPPSFNECIRLTQSLKDADLDLSSLESVYVDTFDENGDARELEVDNVYFEKVEKEFSGMKSDINDASELIESHLLQNWNTCAQDAFYWVSELNLGLDWQTSEWMESAFIHQSEECWVSYIIRLGSLEKGPSFWTDEYEKVAKNHHKLLNFDHWWKPLIYHYKYLGDKRAVEWLNHLLDLTANQEWLSGEYKSGGFWKQAYYVPAQEKINNHIKSFFVSNVWDNCLTGPSLFWDTLLKSQTFEFKNAKIHHFIYQNRDEKSMEKMDSWFETWQKKMIRLNQENIWQDPIPTNRPELPLDFNNWNDVMNWWSLCEKSDTLGWHAIRDAMSRNKAASQELKTWIEKADLNAKMPKSKMEAPIVKIRL